MTLLKIALHLGLQHFVDIINYVDYKIRRLAWSVSQLSLLKTVFFCHVYHKQDSRAEGKG